MFLFLIEFAGLLWAQFLFMQGVSTQIYVAFNIVLIGGNIFGVLSELGNDPVRLLFGTQSRAGSEAI
ncbi:MAG: hypothetical protein LUQ40_01720 [Methanomicrobiales archaeon]|nr:hypothetical protein [Methanomicrobiales archaeon]